MPNHELLNYIRKELERGVSEKDLRIALDRIGWNEDEIEEAFKINGSKGTGVENGGERYAIETRNLTKYYGKARGVKDLNLRIKEGEIFGFLGPNGAGKTTTIRLLLHLINPTSGEAYIFNTDVKEDYPYVLSNIGYLAGDINLYDKYTGRQLLDFASQFYNNSKEYKENLINRLECNMDTPFKNLSRGNRQKIGILLALFYKPRLVILDEPTSGLDPLTQNELYDILLDLKRDGITIFFSSHNLPEVERICDRIGIIRDGEIVNVETIKELRAHRRKIVEIYFNGEYLEVPFMQLHGIEIIEDGKDYVRMYVKSATLGPLLKLLTHYDIKDINISFPDLENVFMKYYGDTQHG
ncbi:MAG: ABC transporter ATP-binding protein [Parcubacteria group bacterium]